MAAGAGASHYFVRKSDPLYSDVAYPRNFWPQFSPFDLGPNEEFPELYTEYWWNDYNPPTCGPSNIKDNEGRNFPHLNGGIVDRFPSQNDVVPITEYGWGRPAEKIRHNGSIQMAFLDGHAELKKRREYYDVETPNIRDRLDYDGFGNRPFYVWGMSKAGSSH